MITYMIYIKNIKYKMSGVSGGLIIDDSSYDAFNMVKTKKKDFVIYEIKKEKLVTQSLIFPDENNETDFNEFNLDVKDRTREANFHNRVFPKFKQELLKRKSPCYAVLDLRYLIGDKPYDKVIFVFWSPDDAPIREKMIYASTYLPFRSKLNVSSYMTIKDASDLDLKLFIAKVTGK